MSELLRYIFNLKLREYATLDADLEPEPEPDIRSPLDFDVAIAILDRCQLYAPFSYTLEWIQDDKELKLIPLNSEKQERYFTVCESEKPVPTYVDYQYNETTKDNAWATIIRYSVTEGSMECPKILHWVFYRDILRGDRNCGLLLEEDFVLNVYANAFF